MLEQPRLQVGPGRHKGCTATCHEVILVSAASTVNTVRLAALRPLMFGLVASLTRRASHPCCNCCSPARGHAARVSKRNQARSMLTVTLCHRPEARAPAPAMPAMPQTAGGAAQSDAPAVDDAGMTPATHARMAAYAAMVRISPACKQNGLQ